MNAKHTARGRAGPPALWRMWCAGGVALALLLLTFASCAPQQHRDWAVAASDVPTQVCAGQVFNPSVTLTNHSDLFWPAQGRLRLSYRWVSAAGDELEGARTRLTAAIAPGATRSLAARVEAPHEAGTWRLRWALVEEGRRWWSAPQGGWVEHEVVVAGQPALAFDVADAAWSSAREDDGLRVAEAWITNTGCEAWDPDAGYRWSTRLRDEHGNLLRREGRRTEVAARVEPGRSQLVRVAIDTPSVEGDYQVELALVHESVQWALAPSQRVALPLRVDRPQWGWAFMDARPPVPKFVPASDTLVVPIRVVNRGHEAWDTAAGDRWAYRWIPRKGNGAVDLARSIEGRRSVGPDTMPGERGTVHLSVVAPEVPGDYVLRVEPLREGVRWYGARTEHDVTVEVGKARLAMAVEQVDAPWLWGVHGRGTVRVRVRNEGHDAWRAQDGVSLAYHLLHGDGSTLRFDGPRTALPHDVAPGETVVAELRLQGPGHAGWFGLQVAVVKEGVAWAKRGDGHDAGMRAVWWSWVAVPLWWGLTWAGVRVARGHAKGPPSDRAAALSRWLRPNVFPLWCVGGAALLAWQVGELSNLPAWSGGVASRWACAALWCAPAFFAPRSWRAMIVLAWSAASAGVALADLAYLDFFGAVVPVAALAAMQQLGDVGGSAGALWRPEYAALLALPLSAVGWLRVSTGARVHERRQGWVAPVAWVVLLLVGGAPVVQRLADGLGSKVFSQQHNVGRYGVWGAHLVDLWQVARGGRPPSHTQAEFRAEALRRAEARPVPNATSRPKPWNVVLVQVEAWEHFAWDAEVAGAKVMPYLAGLRRGGAWTFDQVFDQTGQGRTSDAEYLALSSHHGLAEGALAFLRAEQPFATLAHELRAHGYNTLSAHPYKRGFWNRSRLHPRYGFERSLFRRELGAGATVGWGLSDRDFLTRMSERLQKLPEPFFAFLVTLSLHHPYDHFPPALREMDLGELEGTPLGNYLHGMRHFDRAFEAFMGQLRASGLAERTLVVLYGDHVSRLEASSERLALAGRSDAGRRSQLEMHRVPLVILRPDGRGSPSPRVGGQIDVAPTLLYELGRETPAHMYGRPLTAPSADDGGHAVLSDGRIVTDDLASWSDGRCEPRRADGEADSASCRATRAAAEAELGMSRAVLEWDASPAELVRGVSGPP